MSWWRWSQGCITSTPHYAGYDAVLVRMAKIDAAALKGLLMMAHHYVTAGCSSGDSTSGDSSARGGEGGGRIRL